MRRLVVILLLTLIVRTIAGETASTKFQSPDGRFALRIVGGKVDLIETSGKILVDLGTLWVNHEDAADREEPMLIWSPDSKWVAYGLYASQSGSTTVYHWNGVTFDEVNLPANLPDPKLDSEKVKPKGYALSPLRWVKAGELELSNELMGLMRDEPGYCTARVVITVNLTGPSATVKKVGKTETSISR